VKRKIRNPAVRMMPVFAALAASAAFTAPMSTHQVAHVDRAAYAQAAGSSVGVAPPTTDADDGDVFPRPRPKAVLGYPIGQ